MDISDISDERFDQMISHAMDVLPKEYIGGLKNIAVVIADYPNEGQRHKAAITPQQTLFGLYEGIPLTRRGSNYNMVLPDKITMFKYPLLMASRDERDLQEKVTRILWHEIAHYYGLGHNRIEELEAREYGHE